MEAGGKHRDELLDGRLLGVTQGGILADLHDADALVAEKNSEQFGAFGQGQAFCVREVSGR